VGSYFSANAGSEVNIYGGVIGDDFDANNGSEVNITGGTVGFRFSALSGSVINISGGKIGSVFAVSSGSEVNISGGSMGSSFLSGPGSDVYISGGKFGQNFQTYPSNGVELFGGEFAVDGVTYSRSSIDLDRGSVLSGTFSDGSTFIFADTGFTLQQRDILDHVKLHSTPLPAIDTTPIVVDTPFPDRPSGLRRGQSLTLLSGGELGDDFEMVDAVLNIAGGQMGDDAGAAGSVINISSASLGNGFNAYDDCTVNISGGVIGAYFEAYKDTEVNISGGVIGNYFRAGGNSEVNLIGTEFSIDGVPIDNLSPGETLQIDLIELFFNDREIVLAGTLADGNPFSFDVNTRMENFSDFFNVESKLSVTLVPEPNSLVLLALGAGLAVLRRRA